MSTHSRWLRAHARVGVLIACGAVGSGACGGSTQVPEGSGGGAGSVNSDAGPSGSAGSSGKGGSGGTGGAIDAGVAGAAGTSGGAGGRGGSGGGVPDSWFACRNSPECMLVENRCCQACGPQDLSQALSVNSAFWDQLEAELCKDQVQPCPEVDCMPPLGHITAVCRENRCQAIDVRTDEVSACTTREECVLRWGAECCEWCGGQPDRSIVALSASSDYLRLFCGDLPVPCDACMPPPIDPLFGAVCGSDGHCKVVVRD